MPDYCKNTMIFNDLTYKEKCLVKESIFNYDRCVDFNILIPQPLNIWQGDCGDKHIKKFNKTWYEWNIENWGTKWNAGTPIYKERKDLFLVKFETAWNPPYPWLAAFFNKTEIEFKFYWHIEDDCIKHYERFHIDECGMQWDTQEKKIKERNNER